MSKFVNSLICVCFVFSIVFFSGCSVISGGSMVYADGSRAYSYTITFDEAKLQNLGLDQTQLTNDIETLANNIWVSTSVGKNTIGVNFKVTKKDNTVDIMLTFDTFKNYCDFFGITEEQLNEPPTLEDHIFITRQILANEKLTSIQDILGQMLISESLYSQLITYFANKYFNGNADTALQIFTSSTLAVTRIFPQELKVRSNATIQQSAIGQAGVALNFDAKYSMHMWVFDLSEPINETIYMYRNGITFTNLVYFYLMAIGAALLVGLIIFLILYFRGKTKKPINKDDFDETKTREAVAEIDELLSLYNDFSSNKNTLEALPNIETETENTPQPNDNSTSTNTEPKKTSKETKPTKVEKPKAKKVGTKKSTDSLETPNSTERKIDFDK